MERVFSKYKNSVSFLVVALLLALGGVGCSPTVDSNGAKKGGFESCSEDGDCDEGANLKCIDAPGLGKRCRIPIGKSCTVGERVCVGKCEEVKEGDKKGICLGECQSESDCAALGMPNGKCFHTVRKGGVCVESCSGKGKCSNGFVCDTSLATPVCVPQPAASKLSVTETPIKCVDIEQDKEGSITFEVPKKSAGYTVNLFTKNGTRVAPVSFTVNDDKTYPIKGPYSPYAYMVSQNFTNATTHVLMFPMSPEARETFMDEKEVNKVEYKFIAPSPDQSPGTPKHDEFCYTVLDKTKPGKRLDINLYLLAPEEKVGSDHVVLNSDNAKSSVLLKHLIDKMKSIYKAQGISIGKVRYIDPEPAIIAKYKNTKFKMLQGYIPDTEVVYDLVKEATKDQGENLEDRLAVNIFLCNSFSYNALLGVSTGIPGASVLPGTTKSGVLFSIEIGNEPESIDTATGEKGPGYEELGNTMAHEVGHFLGLAHTTEMFPGKDALGRDVQYKDPLSDTPVCGMTTIESRPESCPDFNNLMFPASGLSHTILTKEQGDVMKAHPLVK